MKKAIIPGSFDPITKGHISIIRAAAEMFYEVYVVILANTEKSRGMFLKEERLSILNAAVEELKRDGVDNVYTAIYDGLTTDAALKFNCDILVKSVRNFSDFEYELNLADITQKFDSNLQTIFIPALPSERHISSTYIRERIKYGRFDGDDFAPGTVNIIRELRSSSATNS